MLPLMVLLVASAVSSAAPPAQRSWDEALSLAKAAVSGLSTEERVSIVSGIGWRTNACLGAVLPLSSKISGFEGLCLQDGPAGVREAVGNSVFASGINTAATFNVSLMYEVGYAIGEEFRGKGVNVWLGPVLNLARSPAGGRNWEGAGGDPYLSSISVSQQIRGAQAAGVIATAKHYYGNEQEHYRTTESSNIDDRTLREVYLQPFKAAVDAGVGAVMCSYNRINGTQSCENPRSIAILKKDLGFKGFVMTDWWATKASSESANAGTDMMMPGNIESTTTLIWNTTLVNQVRAGTVIASRLEDMAVRVISAWYKVGQDKDFPKISLRDATVNVQGNHAALIRQVGVESTILLKNVRGALPLRSGLQSLSIIGQDSSNGTGPNAYEDRGGISGTVAIGWGSGTANFPYLVTPEEAIRLKSSTFNIAGPNLRVANSNDFDLVAAKNAATHADAALVFVFANSGEQYIKVDSNEGDRNNLSLWRNGDELVNAVASVNRNTIVIVHSPGAVDMPWLNHDNITAVVMALFPGQESGNAIADVLFGTEPAGRLPFTINANRTMYCCDVNYSGSDVSYTEGMFIDYMWNDYIKNPPLFWFGHGLSYTTFRYSNLTTQLSSSNSTGRPTISTSINVSNIGDVAGVEVVQLYLGYPTGYLEPLKKLRGFAKIHLEPGQSKLVNITAEDLTIWDVNVQAWAVPAGNFTIFVGASAGDIRLTSTLAVQGNATIPPPFTPARASAYPASSVSLPAILVLAMWSVWFVV
ncbi:glycoside hydrolase superfamily [Cladochytrium replicatum]|nr:glycoside hydrolase superfamily [Cladochytrium replicatum]